MKFYFLLFFMLICNSFLSVTNANNLNNFSDINDINKTISCPLPDDIDWEVQKDSFAKGFYFSKNKDTGFSFASEPIYRFNEDIKKPTKFIKSVISTGNITNTISCIYKANKEEQTILTKETEQVRLIPNNSNNWEQLQSISPLIISTKECDNSEKECSIKIEE